MSYSPKVYTQTVLVPRMRRELIEMVQNSFPLLKTETGGDLRITKLHFRVCWRHEALLATDGRYAAAVEVTSLRHGTTARAALQLRKHIADISKFE
jgi:hypothetical protein